MTAERSHNTVLQPKSRTASARQFVLGTVWMMLSFQTYGLFIRGLRPEYASLAAPACTLLALLCGFYVFASVFDGEPHPIQTIGYVVRPTTGREWGMGLAIGWGMMVTLTLPMMLLGRVIPTFNFSAQGWNSVILSLVTLTVAALAEETGFRGYPFQRLIEAVGPAWATVLMAVVFGLVQLQGSNATPISTLTAILGGMLYSVAYLRTRAVWLSWGLHLGWTASMGVVFGFPINGTERFGSVVQMMPTGASWLTGGVYGPEASVLAPIVMLAGIIVMVRLTRDYAWEYTFEPPQGAGYPMDAPEPPQHQQMEQAAKPAPLVQILPTTPQQSAPIAKPESHHS